MAQITAGTVIPAVVKANSHSNGKGQISTPLPPRLRSPRTDFEKT